MPFLVEDEITNFYIHVPQKGMQWRAGNWRSLESHVGVFLDPLVCGFLFLFPFGKRLSRLNEDGRGEVLASPPGRWQPQGHEYQRSEVAYTQIAPGVCVFEGFPLEGTEVEAEAQRVQTQKESPSVRSMSWPHIPEKYSGSRPAFIPV